MTMVFAWDVNAGLIRGRSQPGAYVARCVACATVIQCPFSIRWHCASRQRKRASGCKDTSPVPETHFIATIKHQCRAAPAAGR